MSRASGIREGIYRSGLARRLARWLEVAPHPQLACEIAPRYVAAARWTRRGASLEGFAVEPLPEGAVVPSAVEGNLLDVSAVRAAVARVLERLRGRSPEVALLLPDPVIRVFVLNFDEFPRNPQEAMPLLRWKLKKSVPFETEETLISFTRQSPRDGGVEVLTALARLRIVREYEMLAEAVGLVAGVVLSSSLAAIPLLGDTRPAMLARVSGSFLTTAIVREGVMCGYRCTELPADVTQLTVQALVDEIYPVAAFYQDAWHEGIQSLRLAGLGERLEEFRKPLERELRCSVGALLASAVAEGRIHSSVQPLCDRQLDALVGWMLNRGA